MLISPQRAAAQTIRELNIPYPSIIKDTALYRVLVCFRGIFITEKKALFYNEKIVVGGTNRGINGIQKDRKER